MITNRDIEDLTFQVVKRMTLKAYQARPTSPKPKHSDEDGLASSSRSNSAQETPRARQMGGFEPTLFPSPMKHSE